MKQKCRYNLHVWQLVEDSEGRKKAVCKNCEAETVIDT